MSRRTLLAGALALGPLTACAPGAPAPTPAPSPEQVDFAALQADVERTITTGPPTLDRVRAVLVTVDGQPRMTHYRRGAAASDHRHVFSVTKSVTSGLVGIAIEDGLISGLDAKLGEVLPRQRASMSAALADATLRELMTMSAGVEEGWNPALAREAHERGDDFVAFLVGRPAPGTPGSVYLYSDLSAHLVGAVLAEALRRAERPGSVLDDARTELFDPLGIDTRSAYTGFVADPLESPAFDRAGFGWATDPNGRSYGCWGLRLTAPDMVKIGQLYLDDGVHAGRRILPDGWVRESTTPSPRNDEYGLLWKLTTGTHSGPFFFAQGRFGQIITVVPERRTIIVVLSDPAPSGTYTGLEPDDLPVLLNLLGDRLT